MSGEKSQSPPRWKVWLKRIGLGLLVLVLVIVTFHRPLFFEGIRYFVLRAAKQQNLEIDYTMNGSIFTTLSVTNLKATPVEPGPIQRMEIGSLHLRYSLWDLLRGGLPAFLEELHFRDVYIEMEPGEPLPPEKEEELQAFKFPALIPDVLALDNVNFVLRAPTGNTVLEGLTFTLSPDEPGVLKLDTVDIPGIRRWTDISAETTFRNRNLVLSDLVVGSEIALDEFRLDLSALNESQIQVALDGTIFDAPIAVVAQINDLNASNNIAALDMNVSALVLDRAWDYLNLDVPFSGTLQSVTLSFSGVPMVPSGWRGTLAIRVAEAMSEGFRIGTLHADIQAEEGKAQAAVRVDTEVGTLLTLQATTTLPEQLDEFTAADAHGKLEIRAPDLATLTLPANLGGDAYVDADFTLVDGLLGAAIAVKSNSFAALDFQISQTELRVDFAKGLPPPAEAPWFQDVRLAAVADIGAVRYSQYKAENLDVTLQLQNGRLFLENLSLAQGENSLTAEGSYELPPNGSDWQTQPLEVDFDMNLPRLEDFVIGGTTPEIGGFMSARGTVASGPEGPTGKVDVRARDLAFQGFRARSFEANLEMQEQLVTLSRLAVVFDDHNHVNGKGSIHLGGSMPYRGELDVALQNLSKFQDIVGENQIAGALHVLWRGSGSVHEPIHEGHVSTTLAGGTFGDLTNLNASFTANYSPGFVDLPNFHARVGGLGEASLALFWSEGRLQITDLLVKQQKPLLEGQINIPLRLSNWREPAGLIPFDEPLTVALKSSDVRIADLLRSFSKKEPAIRANTSFDLSARGTLDDLSANLTFHATGVTVAAAEKLDPATVRLSLTLKEDRLTLDGTATQRLVQPLNVIGSLPFDAAAVIRKGAWDDTAPLDFRARLPRTSVAALPTVVPDLRRSQGTAALDLRVNGTLQSPELAGNMEADLTALRMTDPSLPPVNDFTLRMRFAGTQLMLERCSGIIAGGTFALDGSIDFSSPTDPDFDLRLGSRNALVLQNDDLTVRVSSALRVTGPLSAGTVEGDVWITRSRFFRKVDILPIGLPGRPAPQPPAEPEVVSFPAPPLRDWKFDIRIRTQDPLLVQSNLALGRIVMDLKLGGTGLRPWLNGTVNIENLTASLPFSRLQIDDGQVFFTKQEPFVPQLNLTGTSTIRNYDVNVNITGSAFQPEAIFMSNPPLPQADVVALIATGMTTSELEDDPHALAGRAAFLVFQRLYNKFFHRGRPPPPSDTFWSRIQFDIGAIDPATGRQSTTIRVPLSDQVMLSGGLDVGGNFRGQVKYLIRFK